MGVTAGADADRVTRERTILLTRAIVRILVAATFVLVGLSFLDPRNDVRITLAIHGVDLMLLAVAWWSIGHGRARFAAWLISWMFWLVVAASAWLFGGLQYELSAAYIVSVMVAGSTLGGRPAMFFAALSIAMSTVVLAAHLGGWLPPPISPPSVINAWISITISLLLGAYLLRVAMQSLEDALATLRDNAAERDRAQSRYLQAQKMEPVGRLAAGVAHDFNNLLSAITTIVAVLRRRIGDQPRALPLLDDLDAATDRAALMTRQLLAFSRARAPAFDVLELDPFLARAVPLFARMLGDDVRIDLVLGARGARLRADRGQLEQVFLNLAVNARDAMPQGGTLRIVTTLDEVTHRLRVEVKDTGAGIDAHALPRLFEPFFTTKSTGTGLGLATVHDIVVASGGSISVHSERMKGACFTLEFPEDDGSIEFDSLAVASPLDELPPDLRVLLVEDHDLVRRATRDALEDAGFDVATVNDGVEAIALLDAGSLFDVIVTDLQMPRMPGERLVRILAERGLGVPVVLMSGHAEKLPEGLRELAYPLRFLAKPAASGAMLAAIRELLGDRSSRSSAEARAVDGVRGGG